MKEYIDSEIVDFVLSYLIEEMGGVLDLDSSILIDRIKNGEKKALHFTFINGLLRIETVNEETENQTAE